MVRDTGFEPVTRTSPSESPCHGGIKPFENSNSTPRRYDNVMIILLQYCYERVMTCVAKTSFLRKASHEKNLAHTI